MTDLSAFPITQRWPGARPDVIQLYSLPTPNGIKVSAMLEETELDYEPHLVKFADSDQKTEEFLSLNPNGKIPAILDPDGPGGLPIGLFESGAILVYLADKTGQLLPAHGAARYECLQWVFFQMGGLGPMFGQFGYFHKFAGEQCDHPHPLQRYRDESRRLLGVLEGRLTGRNYICGDDYSIADMAAWPWVRTLGGFYDAHHELGMDDFTAIDEWLDRCEERPASQRSLNIPDRNG
jgi:GST-like protein